jgi:hypothetical protein
MAKSIMYELAAILTKLATNSVLIRSVGKSPSNDEWEVKINLRCSDCVAT